MVLLELYTFLLSLTQLVKRRPQEIRISICGLNRLLITIIYNEHESKELLIGAGDFIHIHDGRTMAQIMANKVDQLN